MNDHVIAQFEYKKWHPLTDLPVKEKTDKSAKDPGNDEVVKTAPGMSSRSEEFNALSSVAKTVLYNIAFHLHLTVSERIKSLKLSSRKFEDAKQELVTKGLVIESKTGKILHLIPKKIAFSCFGLHCPYVNIEFIEHSFYLSLLKYYAAKSTSVKKVVLEYKLTASGKCADVAIQRNDGSLEALEWTASVSNIVQNCLKYDKTAFIKITFVCQSNDILKAVKSKVLNAGLPLELLSKIDYLLLSHFIKATK